MHVYVHACVCVCVCVCICIPSFPLAAETCWSFSLWKKRKLQEPIGAREQPAPLLAARSALFQESVKVVQPSHRLNKLIPETEHLYIVRTLAPLTQRALNVLSSRTAPRGLIPPRYSPRPRAGSVTHSHLKHLCDQQVYLNWTSKQCPSFSLLFSFYFFKWYNVVFARNGTADDARGSRTELSPHRIPAGRYAPWFPKCSHFPFDM